MRIQPINPPMSKRYTPDVNDRAWLVMQNDGSGSDGASTARAGDVTCLHLDSSNAPTYTDSAGVTQLAGFGAIECHATNAPVSLCLGAWHDTPAVGKIGRVQCSGWDDDVRLLPDATPVRGNDAIATAGQPYVDEPGTGAPSTTSGNICTIVDLIDANHIVAATEGNHACWWRAL